MQSFVCLDFASHHRTIIKFRIPSIINDVRDHPKHRETIIINRVLFPSPVLQINQVGLWMCSVTLDPEFPIDCAYQQRAITG